MRIRTNNWKISEITYENYLSICDKIPIINDAEYYPVQHFIAEEIETGIKLLFNQTDVGLHQIPFLTLPDEHYSLFGLTDNCYVIDCVNGSIIGKKTLLTICTDIICISNHIYIICEAEIIEFFPKNREWKLRNLSDSIELMEYSSNLCIITLHNGSQIVLE